MTLAEIFLAAIANNITTRDYLLYLIYQNGSGGGNNPAPTVLTSAVVPLVEGNPNHSIDAGTLAVTFVTSDDFAGTINGVARDASTAYVFNPTAGYLNPAIPFTITAGSVKVDQYTKA